MRFIIVTPEGVQRNGRYLDQLHMLSFSPRVVSTWPWGSPFGISNVDAPMNLRIGEPLAQAKQIYGSSVRTSVAQGGSWFASTSTGTVAGLTTVEVNWTNPQPRIADMGAGSVGCPAVSP